MKYRRVLLVVARFSIARAGDVENDDDTRWRDSELYGGLTDEHYVPVTGRRARLTAATQRRHSYTPRLQLKRRPMFVGKRNNAAAVDYWTGNRRPGPVFVGKRHNPFFVG